MPKTFTKSLPRTPADFSALPPKYFDIRKSFSMKQAAILPLHRPYDCAIELLPSSTPPWGRLYSLSAPEAAAMDDYVHGSRWRQASFINPPQLAQASSSWERRMGACVPDIDHQVLTVSIWITFVKCLIMYVISTKRYIF